MKVVETQRVLGRDPHHDHGQRRREERPAPRRRARDEASVMGIPANELTSTVQSAVMRLMEEVGRLEDELGHARERVSELEDMALEDHLVPVFNRRGFELELERVLSYSRRYGTKAALLYFDLDRFKSINDAHGHAAGDAVLRHFGKLLTDNFRQSDIVGRLGGDEFAVILHHADKASALAKARRLESLARAAEVEISNGGAIRYGFSTGAAALRPDDTVSGVLERADTSMYRQKGASGWKPVEPGGGSGDDVR